MPNHMYSYYSQKWLAWETIASLAIIQVLWGARRYAAIATACAVCAIIQVPIFTGIHRHQHAAWFKAGYLRGKLLISRNVQDTLAANRDEINGYKRVAVLGIGPGQIDQSPWQGGGETAFYLGNDLKLHPEWVLFVKSFGPSYRTDEGMKSHLAPGPGISIKKIDALAQYKKLPTLVFQKDGRGHFVDLSSASNETLDSIASGLPQYQQWTASPDMHIEAKPESIPACPPTGMRSSVQITWNVSAMAARRSIEIWVEKGNARKLWLVGDGVGTAKSGPWVDGGVKFQIEDATTHEPLASATIGGVSCP